ncbi:tetratricopeptide repeat protein [Streptomyces echinatus]|uniref:tetratricopeptide repeat protein n=1 Tax=Streptomyces echinatus TaxID=67293 RepID=UPI0031E85B47
MPWRTAPTCWSTEAITSPGTTRRGLVPPMRTPPRSPAAPAVPPTWRPALRGLGDIALEEGDLAEAERLYSEALERIDPHWIKSLGPRVRTLIGLGRVAAARSHHAKAREHYRQAAEVADTAGARAPEVLRMLGLSEKTVGCVLEAVAADR